MYTLPYVHEIQIIDSPNCQNICDIFARNIAIYVAKYVAKISKYLNNVHFTLCTYNTDQRFTNIFKIFAKYLQRMLLIMSLLLLCK